MFVINKYYLETNIRKWNELLLFWKLNFSSFVWGIFLEKKLIFFKFSRGMIIFIRFAKYTLIILR